MVHGWVTYIVGYGPRRNGAMPGQVSRKSSPSMSAAEYDCLTSIPSGVSHGSPDGAGVAGAVGVNGMLVKSGIWVMVSSRTNF